MAAIYREKAQRNLSDNNPSGDIPFSVSKLKNLEVLNLKNNQLTCHIATTLTQIPNLRTLDLSRNQLTGEIPRLISWNEVLHYLGLRGKTLLARAIASKRDANFLKVVSSAIIDKFIGESARLIREMFGYACDHQPCIIFMDEIDAIGGRHFSKWTSADCEIQRTLMELPNQLDGFDQLGKFASTE
ncbi:26S proteasome regulatory subunit S10B homolog B-like [Rosa chinensis]|uniref:26S proteasome regulatory subunit S10B homolog B-like n=1 Tax=Rosa chinensis TaxID=74649 RepID=UPI001AD94384|nr:26S proteasome regulatory subunit S10B homolog B-like [Rosa chinensis]